LKKIDNLTSDELIKLLSNKDLVLNKTILEFGENSSGIYLNLADPYIFATPNGKTGIYSLTIFCYQNQNCAYLNSYKKSISFFSLNTTDKQKAQEYLEIV
jgi:hypothetical protein